MAKKEMFINRVFEIVNELKVPIIDKRVCSKRVIRQKEFAVIVSFKFEEDESVIRGFLTLADYFKTVVIKKKERFFIPKNNILFKLESS